MKKQMLNKKNIQLFIIIILLGIATTVFFIPFHTVPDTYNVLWQKQNYCTTFLKDGRIFSALFLWIGSLLKIPINVLDVISNIISLFANCTSVYIIYKNITNNENSKLENVVLFIGTFLIIFNSLAMEHLAYFETGIMCIGKMLCVIAANRLVIKRKLVIPLTTLTTALFCYQGILNVFVITTLIFIIMKKDTIKEDVKNVLKMVLICILAFGLAFIEIKICNLIMNSQDNRLTIGNLNVKMIERILKFSTGILYTTFNIEIPNFTVLAIAVTLTILLINKKYRLISQYLLSILIIIGSCIVQAFFSGIGSISARTISAIGGIAGFSVILLVELIRKGKLNKIFISSIAIILFTVSEYMYLENGYMLYKSNKMEQKYANEIAQQVKKYENETGNLIKNVSFYFDKSQQKTFNGYRNNSFTIKALYTRYANADFLRYALKEDIKITEQNAKYVQYFNSKDWDEYDVKQLEFDGNTLHLCVF